MDVQKVKSSVFLNNGNNYKNTNGKSGSFCPADRDIKAGGIGRDC
jgi:hypothetical protein